MICCEGCGEWFHDTCENIPCRGSVDRSPYVAMFGDGTKPGLWTLDWTMDWTMDWNMDR